MAKLGTSGASAPFRRNEAPLKFLGNTRCCQVAKPENIARICKVLSLFFFCFFFRTYWKTILETVFFVAVLIYIPRASIKYGAIRLTRDRTINSLSRAQNNVPIRFFAQTRDKWRGGTLGFFVRQKKSLFLNHSGRKVNLSICRIARKSDNTSVLYFRSIA